MGKRRLKPRTEINGEIAKLYLKCPKKLQFSLENLELHSLLKKNKSSISLECNVIKKVVQRSFEIRSRRNVDLRWKDFPNILDDFFLKYLQEKDLDEQFNHTKKVLSKLQKFYNEYYTKEFDGPGLPNIPIEILLNNCVLYKDTIDIVYHKEEAEIITFKDVPNITGANASFFKYDLDIYLKPWSFWKSSKILPTKHHIFCVGPETIKILTLKIDIKHLENIENFVKLVSAGIENKVYIPSVSDRCNTCPFKARCSIF